MQMVGIQVVKPSDIESRTMSKVTWRLVPFLMLCYFIAYLDRVNIGFAGATMRADLDLSATAFGGAAGIFFLAYFFFEVPSNLALKRRPRSGTPFDDDPVVSAAGESGTKAALERARSHSSQTIQIDPALLEQFGRTMRENFSSVSIPFRKAYLQSLIDVIEVDDTQIRIKGSKDVLERAVLASRNGAIPGSQMSTGWRTRHDSNV
jgi:hypothetical protein